MGALIALAVTIAPEIARWLFGDGSEKTVAAASSAVEAATGTADADAAASVLQKDPSIASKLRMQLAQIAAEREKASHSDDLDQFAAALRDASDAGTATAAPGGQKGPLAWSAPIISGVVLLTFGSVMGVVLLYGMPAGSETAANMLLGTMAAMATSVVSYWVGSSAGSARKEERLAQVGK